MCFCYKQTKSTKNELEHPRWQDFAMKVAPIYFTGVLQIGTAPLGGKIAVIDKCSNEVYVLRFQILTSGNFFFIPRI